MSLVTRDNSLGRGCVWGCLRPDDRVLAASGPVQSRCAAAWRYLRQEVADANPCDRRGRANRKVRFVLGDPLLGPKGKPPIFGGTYPSGFPLKPPKIEYPRKKTYWLWHIAGLLMLVNLERA